MKINLKNLSILIMSVLPLVGCSTDNTTKENDVVVWELSPKFILKTELSENRDLEVTRKLTAVHYMGVYPVVFDSDEHQTISESKLESFSEKALKVSHIEFDLSLNGASFKPNDSSIFSDYVLTSDDQVRVYIHSKTNHETKPGTIESIKKGNYQAEISKKYNMPCYSIFDNEILHESYHCILLNKKLNTEIPLRITGSNNEFFLFNETKDDLGINLYWKVSTKKKSDLEKIHNHILNLLKNWNVA